MVSIYLKLIFLFFRVDSKNRCCRLLFHLVVLNGTVIHLRKYRFSFTSYCDCCNHYWSSVVLNRWYSRYFPPLILRWCNNPNYRSRCIFLCTRSGTISVFRAWSLGTLGNETKSTLDGTLKMASLLLRCSGILEYVRCWRIWFLNQSTNFALLYPRLDHDCCSCSRRIIRWVTLLSTRLRILNRSLFTSGYTI